MDDDKTDNEEEKEDEEDANKNDRLSPRRNIGGLSNDKSKTKDKVCPKDVKEP